MRASQKSSEEEKCVYLSLFLEVIAEKFSRNLPKDVESSYRKSKSALVTRHSPLPVDSSLELDCCQKGLIEEADNFSCRIKNLVDLTYSSFGAWAKVNLFSDIF
ncbi:hypothetical protein RF11_10940 [Thelohanellus kitauei]|uniref:Uncharacterized protein n=1 Tax=Thelohanellus kitauei TaxID=669202 RepID=A0A0C2MRC0_THEKT|nr:hypothetical protein RF11_10940 [Thelohanellus kitauei]